MAEITTLVDPDGGAGYDYLTLNAWNTAEATDLITAGDSHIVYCRSSAGSADTTACAIDTFDWECDVDNTLTIQAADGDEAQKDGWKTDRYRLDVIDADALKLDTADGYVALKGIQVRSQYLSTAGNISLHLNTSVAGSGPVVIDSCRIENTNFDGVGFAVSISDDDYDLTIQNCIIENADRVLLDISSGTVKVYNCVIAHQDYGFGDGVLIDAGVYATVTNCVIFDTSDDIDDSASSTIDHCASDDGDGTNSVSPSGSDWDNEFNDPANGDFTLLNTGNCYHGGTTITGGPTYDIDGDEWDASTPSIGVDEYVSAGGGATIPIMMHHYAMMRN